MNNIKCDKCDHDGWSMDKDGTFTCTKCGSQMAVKFDDLRDGKRNDAK